ncbi:TPA: GGDEF domain-containing protein [Legionella bozemanae]
MKKLLSHFLLFNAQFPEEEREIRYQFIFLNNVFFFACVVAFFMGFIRWHHSKLMGSIDFGFSALSLGLLYYLHHHKNKIKLLSTLALVLAFVLFFFIYLLAPYQIMRLSLFYLLTAAAFFLKGRREGFLWMVFIVIAIVLGHYCSYFNTGYSHFDILTTSLYLLGLFFICDNYGLIQEEQKEHLNSLNALLEETVRKRTRELEETNKALEIEKQALRYLSYTDQLTGLYNRHKLQELFEFEKNQVLRYKTDLSIILMDLDSFKSVNDEYGHQAGDMVLKEIALILQSSLRSSDVVARWGGEEFLIITPKTALNEAVKVADSLRQKIKSSPFSYVGKMTASFGVAVFKKEDNLEQLIQRADHALYLAKESGKDRVKYR